MNSREWTEWVKRSGHALGFDAVSVSRANALDADGDRYRDWCKDGHAAGMAYMVREEPRRWTPKDLLPEARSVVTFAVNFFSGEKRVPPKRGFGRVARYAWGKDYHEVVRDRLEEWVRGLRESVGPGLQTKILVDSSPLLERAFAREGGLGFVGKNTLLISRALGSFIFLAEVLTSLELEPDVWTSPVAAGKDECGSCRLCIADCPTGALIQPRVLDARKCISYWTIEHRGEIPMEMRAGIGDWIFGCDVCQDVCPYNGLSKPGQWPEFKPESGAGPYLDIMEVLGMEEAAFKARFKGTPLLRTKRAGLVRNACVVATNQNLTEAAGLLETLAKNDADAVVRDHAAWALMKLKGQG